MPVEPSIQMWVTFGFIAVAVVTYALERITLELTSLLLLAGLLVFFHLFPVSDGTGANLLAPKVLLAGFAEPALISILALLVIGQGLIQTGALNTPARFVMSVAGGRPILGLAFVFAVVVLCSAFLNNTPVVVIFIPIMAALADRFDRPASTVMMPLSFIAILGGMTTLIGSSTNLLVAAAFEDQTGQTIGFFDFTVPGLVLAGVGALYVIFIAPRLLPDRSSLADEIVGSDGKQFIAQIEVRPGGALVGQTPVAGMFPSLPDVTVRLVQRGEEPILPPYDEELVLRAGDTIIVAATRRALTDIFATTPEILEDAIEEPGPSGAAEDALPTRDRILADVVIAPASRMIGRNLEQIGFHYQTGCIVLGIQRRSRMIRTRMNQIRLEAGDVLLIIGKRSEVKRLRANRDVLLLEWSAKELPARSHAKRATFIFLAVVALAASGTLPIVIAALLGAGVMVLGGCLNTRQAIRALDQRVILIIGTALALGTTLYVTGGAQFVAHSLVASLAGASVPVILSAFFIVVAVLTNVLSNNATAVLFTPIAVSVASELGVDPMIFVYAVIFAANCSFATPMSYQTNLLVMGPGHYRFVDFVRVGVPLILLIWLTFSVFAPWYYGLW